MADILGYFGESIGRAMSRNNANARFGPATTFASTNAMIEIHEDTPPLVRQRFKDSGISRLRFQFIDTPIDEAMSPTYEQIAVMGRSEPYHSYSGGSGRTINLNLAFASSAEQNDEGKMDMALHNVRWLQALMLPSYDGGGLMYPPPLCRLLLGRSILSRGLVTAANPTFEVWSGDETAFEYPIVARVGLEFTVVNNRPQEARDFLPYFGVRPV